MLFIRIFEQSVQNTAHSCGTLPVQLCVGISSFFVRHYGNKSAYPEWPLDHAERCSYLSVASSLSKLALTSLAPAPLRGPSAMQDPPRRLSAMPFLSSFLQGRRHSASDTVLRLPQGQRSSATKMLSSSSLQVMLAVSSVSCAKRNPTCPERKSKTPFLLKDCHTFEFKFKECEEAVLCLYLFKFSPFYILLFTVCYAKFQCICNRR